MILNENNNQGVFLELLSAKTGIKRPNQKKKKTHKKKKTRKKKPSLAFISFYSKYLCIFFYT